MRSERLVTSRASIVMLTAVLVVVGGVSRSAADAAPSWVEELSQSFALYQDRYPEGNWRPYLDQIKRINATVEGGDSVSIRRAMGELLTMLQNNRFGINGSAAHALFWIALGLIPDDPAMAERVPRSILPV